MNSTPVPLLPNFNFINTRHFEFLSVKWFKYSDDKILSSFFCLGPKPREKFSWSSCFTSYRTYISRNIQTKHCILLRGRLFITHKGNFAEDVTKLWKLRYYKPTAVYNLKKYGLIISVTNIFIHPRVGSFIPCSLYVPDCTHFIWMNTWTKIITFHEDCFIHSKLISWDAKTA
jgi:hypothetical protein